MVKKKTSCEQRYKLYCVGHERRTLGDDFAESCVLDGEACVQAQKTLICSTGAKKTMEEKKRSRKFCCDVHLRDYEHFFHCTNQMYCKTNDPTHPNRSTLFLSGLLPHHHRTSPVAQAPPASPNAQYSGVGPCLDKRFKGSGSASLVVERDNAWHSSVTESAKVWSIAGKEVCVGWPGAIECLQLLVTTYTELTEFPCFDPPAISNSSPSMSVKTVAHWFAYDFFKRLSRACLARDLGTSYTPCFSLRQIFFFLKKKRQTSCNTTIQPKKKKPWSQTNRGSSTPTRSGFEIQSPVRKERDGQFLPNMLTANNSSDR